MRTTAQREQSLHISLVGRKIIEELIKSRTHYRNGLDKVNDEAKQPSSMQYPSSFCIILNESILSPQITHKLTAKSEKTNEKMVGHFRLYLYSYTAFTKRLSPESSNSLLSSGKKIFLENGMRSPGKCFSENSTSNSFVPITIG